MIDVKALLTQDFAPKVQRKIYSDILEAIKIYNVFMVDNRIFFSYPNFSSLKGELLSYSVSKVLNDSAFTPKANYRVMPKEVNGYKRNILHMETDHFKTTLAKTKKNGQLPCKSKYKKEYAISNKVGEGQYSLFGIDNEIQTVELPKLYAIITYGYNDIKKECSHANILVPDSIFKKPLEVIDLARNYIAFDKVEDYNVMQQEDIVKLHDELEKIVKLKTSNL
ncbi:MAG: hypothetical protein H2184_04300 [Candidatus Galacturonibacter soehngenii]|nr:hypothetical protein [Candidatus Galacturonibacter soehngenii]